MGEINFKIILLALGIGVGLAMDAFAVSISNGMTVKNIRIKHAVKIGLFFGIFQAVMPAIGWGVGMSFSKYVEDYAHYIAFILLAIVGGKMIFESIKERKSHKDGCGNDIRQKDAKESLNFRVLFILGVATSIDALLIGVSFATQSMQILPMLVSVCIIGIVTFVISFAGVLIGRKYGCVFENSAEIVGGVILILIGLKILIEGIIG